MTGVGPTDIQETTKKMTGGLTEGMTGNLIGEMTKKMTGGIGTETGLTGTAKIGTETGTGTGTGLTVTVEIGIETRIGTGGFYEILNLAPFLISSFYSIPENMDSFAGLDESKTMNSREFFCTEVLKKRIASCLFFF